MRRKPKIACVALAMVAAAGLAFAAPLKSTEFVAYIPNEGRLIPATLCLPAGAPGQSLPAVVMLHGTGSARDEAGNGYKMLAPYMAIAGSDDQDVPLGNLDDIVASAGGKDKAKLLIPGADHTFRVFTGDLTKFNELRDATTAWLSKKL
jgi:fermentation-respiration switch protein FrsA (DUF1100 family)